ncbi:DUF4198 domain-containing protein [Novosphingobium sp. RD2P27]|uniref:DUF4198 domain-containing protein n=1 Tax=Novosphingobium kalidii TaxID=3230299 RepID=A0ABV2D0Z6_9SPHN
MSGSIVYRAILGLALTAAATAPAAAHTAYMLPNVFNANVEQQVTVQSSFAEKFFVPEIAVDADDFHVIMPDGSRAEFTSVAKLKQLVVLESDLREEGTYRFTTGVRRGRVGKMAEVDGKWVPIHDKIPANATAVQTSQTETVSDVFVTKKAPTRAPVDMQIGRLRLQPVTHPSDVYLDGEFALKVMFDGQPLQDQLVYLDRAGAEYEEPKFHREIRTGAEGGLSLSFDQPGVYVLMTRHRADAPAGADTDLRSYTTALTFEVQR